MKLASVGVTATRRGLLDFSASPYLRLFGAAAIVWFHAAIWLHTATEATHALGAVGLGIFGYFAFLQPSQQRGLNIAIKANWNRLFKPYMGWWLIYALVSIWRARGLPPTLISPHSIWVVLAWPSIHLWFLPFVLFGNIGARIALEIAAPINGQLKGCLTLAAGLCAVSVVPVFSKLPSVVGQFWIALGSIGLGLTYGYCLRLDYRDQRQAVFAVSALVALACVPDWLWGSPYVAIGYTGASLLIVLCTIALPRYRFLTRLSTLTLGIYLAHPLALLLVLKVLGPNALLLNFNIVALAAFLLAGLISWAMRKTPYLRQIV
jgi:surface polysaccharide O-acyltransferase-like enzyme